MLELNVYRPRPRFAWRDTTGTVAARLELTTNEAPFLDAANPNGFAAGAVLAAMFDLYPTPAAQSS